MHVQRQKALERLQKNLKEEYRAVVDYEVAFYNTVSLCCGPQWQTGHVQACPAPDRLSVLAEHYVAALHVMCPAYVHLWVNHVLLG